MKKLYFLLCALLITAISFGQDLIITGVIDGPLPGGFPKGIELYVINDIADLSVYGLERAGNGDPSSGSQTYTFPADSYTAGDFIYVGKVSTTDDSPSAFLQYLGITLNYEDDAVNHNGDDTIILYSGGAVVDSFGEIGVDGTGTAWESLDGWAYRNNGAGPNPTFTVAEWTFSGPNALDGCDLGDDSGTNAGCASVFPVGTYSATGSTATTITINSPSDFAVLASGTTSVDIDFTAANLGTGDQVDITVTKNGGTPNKTTDVSSPFTISGTADGDTYIVTAEIINGTTQIDFETIDFSIAFPCDLLLDTITTTCDASTAGVDTYTTTIDFTGGNTGITYTLGTDSGTISGDDPSTAATGTIIITGVNEETDIIVTAVGGAGSSCDLTRNITSPVCVPTTCASIGDIIITEIMQNPSAVFDSAGEWFEVYNTTGSPIDLQGWTLNDSSSSSETHTIATSVIVPAGGYAVLGNNSDITTNGGVTLNYSYGGGYFLGNGIDDVLVDCLGASIDIVAWDDGATFPDPTGASMELASNKLNSSDNDTGTNWQVAVSAFGSGDFGTPGTVNDFVLSVARNAIPGFNMYPNPVTNGRLTINTISNTEKEIQIYNILGKLVLSTKLKGRELNVSKLGSGIYILKILEEGKTATRKLVIK